MKITNPELFRNALKIILVGTGNVLSPHKYFQFERTLKNVVVNSKKYYLDIFGKPSRRTWEPRKPPHGGAPKSGRPREVGLLGAPLAILLCFILL